MTTPKSTAPAKKKPAPVKIKKKRVVRKKKAHPHPAKVVAEPIVVDEEVVVDDHLLDVGADHSVVPHMTEEEEAIMAQQQAQSMAVLQAIMMMQNGAPGASPPEMIRDPFNVICDSFSGDDIMAVNLPKFIMKTSKKNAVVEEKSNILLTFKAGPTVYKDLLMCVKKGIPKITVEILSAPDKEAEDDSKEKIECTWEFKDLRVHAVDYGDLAKIRPDQRKISIELNYATFLIDGIQIKK